MYLTFSKLLSIANIDGPPKEIGISTNDPRFTTISNLTPNMYPGFIINILLGASGVAAFVFFIWGGISWITAGGDKDAMEKARKKITQALIGLAIVFSAYAIIYILRTIFHIEVLGFTLTQLGL